MTPRDPSGRPDPSNHPQTVAAGQIWRYRTRPGEEESRLRVLLVDQHPEHGDVAHVRIDGVHLPNRVYPDRPNTALGHLPFRTHDLTDSLIELVGRAETDPELDGYRLWRDAEGDVFTCSVADAVRTVHDILVDAEPEPRS